MPQRFTVKRCGHFSFVFFLWHYFAVPPFIMVQIFWGSKLGCLMRCFCGGTLPVFDMPAMFHKFGSTFSRYKDRAIEHKWPNQ